MHRRKFKLNHHFVLAIAASFFFVSCLSTPNVIGKWREIGKTATLEFWKDGTFKAVDNEGMSVTGKYFLLNNGNIRFEVTRIGSSPDIINGKIEIGRDELMFRSLDGREIERYRRERRPGP
jgi:hypothetical protein